MGALIRRQLKLTLSATVQEPQRYRFSTMRAPLNWTPSSRACCATDPDHLADTVSRLIAWEAFAYWARPALEGASELPAEVVRELRHRCSGYLDEIVGSPKAGFKSRSRSWDQLMTWIADHFFEDAQKSGWFDADSSAKPSTSNPHDGICGSLRRAV